MYTSRFVSILIVTVSFLRTLFFFSFFLLRTQRKRRTEKDYNIRGSVNLDLIFPARNRATGVGHGMEEEATLDGRTPPFLL